MKTMILTAILALSGNAFAAQNLCGISVQDNNVLSSGGQSLSYIKSVLKNDQARIKHCFNDQGAVLVALFPNGEIRAVIF